MKHIGVSAMSRRPKLLVRVRNDEHKDAVISFESSFDLYYTESKLFWTPSAWT